MQPKHHMLPLSFFTAAAENYNAVVAKKWAEADEKDDFVSCSGQ